MKPDQLSSHVRSPSEAGAAFPEAPVSWFYLCRAKEVDRGPVTISVGGRKYVAFRTASGELVVLSGRCSHMGADLGKGCVVGEAIRCPFHEWEYGRDGRCIRIPASDSIPHFARQPVYPAVERAGHVFFFNHPSASFPLPFFEGRRVEQLLPARAFSVIAELPWYLIGANGFDLQHFRAAHDRALAGPHRVDCPTTFSRRITASYDVTGRSIRDHFTRWFSGRQVTMTVTVWCGNFILVEARFRRATSYGMVCARPISADRTALRVIVWVPRSQGRLARAVFDPLDAIVRRSFIRAFVRADADRSAGVRYDPSTLIPADEELAAYLAWLCALSRGASIQSQRSGAASREIGAEGGSP